MKPAPDASSVIGEETIASGSGGYEFQDRFLSPFFESAGSGGSLNVAFFQSAPQDISGITSSNISPYRWVINNNGVSNFNATFRVPGSGNWTYLPIGNDVVKLVYKRPTPGTDFSDLGYMQYDGVNDEFFKTGITSFSEFVLGSETPIARWTYFFHCKSTGLNCESDVGNQNGDRQLRLWGWEKHPWIMAEDRSCWGDTAQPTHQNIITHRQVCHGQQNHLPSKTDR